VYPGIVSEERMVGGWVKRGGMPGFVCMFGWMNCPLLVHGPKKGGNLCDRPFSQRQIISIRNKDIAQKCVSLTSTSGDVFPTRLPLCTFLICNRCHTFLYCKESMTRKLERRNVASQLGCTLVNSSAICWIGELGSFAERCP
jgi:hypothetical protein